MNKFVISVAALAAAGTVFGQAYTPLPGSLRHPEANAFLPTPASDDEPVHLAISLKPRDLAGLQSFVDQVSDPGSPNYRHFLTPQEVGAQFGPSQADVNAAKAFLTSNGLTVESIAANNFVIVAHGTVAQVSAAFRTSLGHLPRAMFTGHAGTFRTNLTPLQVPSGLVDKIVSVDGVDTSIERKTKQTTTLNPTLFRACYNDSPEYTAGFYGQGVNIGVANWDEYRLDNIPYLIQTYNLPYPKAGMGSNIVVVPVGGGPTDGQGAPAGEGDLDLQAELASAPLATIYDYDDSQSDDAAPITTYSKIASDNIVDICSESYGWLTSDGNTYFGQTFSAAHNIHLSMSAQGISYLVASGDNGTGNFPADGARYSYPDMDPDCMMVGGSVATVNETTGVRESEAPWGLSDGWGGTGGFDPYDSPANGFAFNTPPSYQLKYIPSIVSQYPYRVLPDTVSSAGGQNGLGSSTGTAGWAYQIYFNDAGAGYPLGSLIPIDGTSIASPATAGGLGAVESQLFANVTPNAKRSNVRLGRLMDFLYATGENPAVFYDITTGSSVGNLPGTSTPDVPTVGFDLATGWGAINYAGLESYLRGAVYSVTALGTGVKPAAYGTYLSGTLNSPNSTYDIQSSNVSGLGQVAGTEIDFTPANKPKGYAVSTATLTIGVKSFAGATNQLYFYNWKTNNWVYSEAYPLFGSTVTNTYSLNPATYANPTTGEVRILTRSVLPTRIGTNTYIYQVSKAAVAFSAVPSS